MKKENDKKTFATSVELEYSNKPERGPITLLRVEPKNKFLLVLVSNGELLVFDLY